MPSAEHRQQRHRSSCRPMPTPPRWSRRRPQSAAAPCSRGAIFQSAAAGYGTGQANLLNTGDIVIIADADAYGSVIGLCQCVRRARACSSWRSGPAAMPIATLVNEGIDLLVGQCRRLGEQLGFRGRALFQRGQQRRLRQ